MTAIQARPDNCASCLTPDHAQAVLPYFTRPEGESSIRAFYGCPGCGHTWSTSFLLPVTPEQAAQNARVLDEETAAWEQDHAAGTEEPAA